MGKRQQRTVGSIVKVELSDGYHSYARILEKACFAFYEIRTKDDMEDLDYIISKPIVFIVAGYDDVITKGRWKKIGSIPLENNLKTLPLQFIQDEINSEQFRLYNPNTGNMKLAQKEECKGLERASVWEAEEIEERINDYFAGRKNKLVDEDLIALE